MKKISVIVPCYNEAEVLKIFYAEIDRVSNEMTEYAFQFILWTMVQRMERLQL